ncbi:uncharacterized protein BDV17DRAFT_30810 [Aspergillus undulatus]|uniref:uncharacterized protein n=1 Tax=Aspergillus undulatus TaxID=1810928 RepID=UPI003CCCDE5D
MNSASHRVLVTVSLLSIVVDFCLSRPRTRLLAYPPYPAVKKSQDESWTQRLCIAYSRRSETSTLTSFAGFRTYCLSLGFPRIYVDVEKARKTADFGFSWLYPATTTEYLLLAMKPACL